MKGEAGAANTFAEIVQNTYGLECHETSGC